MTNEPPRHLRLLLIEDESVDLSRLPIEVLGRIHKWAPFVSNLSQCGRIPVPVFPEHSNDESHWKPIDNPPELIAIDFQFHQDNTSPKGGDDWRCPEQFQYSRWSFYLDAPNSGILIGAIAMSSAAQSDLPVVAALYSGNANSVLGDVSTVLLLGCMMAAAGSYFPPLDTTHPFETTRSYLTKLPGNPAVAVLSNMWRFRVGLLEQIGVDEDEIQAALDAELVAAESMHIPDAESAYLKETVKQAIAADISRRESGDYRHRHIQGLFVLPEKSRELLHHLDAAENSNDATSLDGQLEDVGLQFFDRAGEPHCLDLRSVFMDHLMVPKEGRAWGMLPLTSITSGHGEDGIVRAFAARIYRSAKMKFDAAAELVQCNSAMLSKDGGQGSTKTFERSVGPATRMLALLFATIEEAIARHTLVRGGLKYHLPVDPKGVLNLLGYWPEPFNITEVHRIPSSCGYTRSQASTFLKQLWELHIPWWMQEAGEWYLAKFHNNLKTADRPEFRP
jgi:hypothetical protein